MNISYWQNELDKLEQQTQLFEPTNLQQRMEMLKSLEELFRFGSNRFGVRSGFQPILARADAIQDKIDATNESLFDTLRQKVQDKSVTAYELRQVLNDFTHYRQEEQNFFHGGDGLDRLINGTFQTAVAPDPSRDAVIDMVRLEMTPISVILELVDRVAFTAADTFMDIGSGQGQICLLVNLLTQVRAIGIEIDPAYVERAESVVRSIRGETADITFRQSDARIADYADGTIFFMFTPFVGHVFDAVLEQLHRSIQTMHFERSRPLICTHGDITLEVAKLPWLHAQRAADLHPDRLAVFELATS